MIMLLSYHNAIRKVSTIETRAHVVATTFTNAIVGCQYRSSYIHVAHPT